MEGLNLYNAEQRAWDRLLLSVWFHGERGFQSVILRIKKLIFED